MHTVLTTNEGYDTLLLVDAKDRVVSRWALTHKELDEYLAGGANADAWAVDSWPEGFDPDAADNAGIADELRTIACYGEEWGRDGEITNDERRQFWTLSAKRRAASLARKTFAAGPGKPRSNKKRCACGEMTAKRAKARGHKCSPSPI